MTFFQTISRGLVIALSSIQAAIANELPKEIIAEGQWVIADMDGTLIGNPGYKKEPTLDESVAKEAIFNWLRGGGNLLVVTGSDTQRIHERFTRFFPADLMPALIQKRLVIASNGGATLSYFDGTRWTEDLNYQNSAMSTRIVLSKENEEFLVQNTVIVINDFYREIRNNPSFIPETLRAQYKQLFDIARSHPQDFTLDELTSLNTDLVPRIELRKSETGEVVQICVIGIPVDLNYDISKFGIAKVENVHLCKVSWTHQIDIKGVDKVLPINWLQNSQGAYPQLVKEKSIAVGDRPNHNDAPLTTAVRAFVSVCEKNTPSYIPANVTLKIGHNQAGTKLLLEKLLVKAHEFHQAYRYEPVTVHALDEVVQDSASALPH